MTQPDLSPPQQQIREFWNQRYLGEAYAYGTEPNDYLAQQEARLRQQPKGGAALSLADGEGRNGVWLASLGLAVTSVDLAEAGLAKTRALAARRGLTLQTVQADVLAFDLGEARWQAIASIFLHLPAAARQTLHSRIAASLAPGGLFILEAYTPEQLGYGTGGPRDLALLPSADELRADFAPDVAAGRLEWLEFEVGPRSLVEGQLHTGTGHTTRLVLRRTA